MTKAIESAFEDSGLTPIHGAQAIPKGETLDQRIEEIRRATFGIYPLPSLEKMEVLLEIGAALGMGKDITVLCQKGSTLPETLKQLDLIEYEDFSDLTKKLRKKIG